MTLLTHRRRAALALGPVALFLVADMGGSSAALAGCEPAVGSTQSHHKPSTYVVSCRQDTLPEGIDISTDGTMYVGSKGDGTIYRGNVHDRRLHAWLPGGQDGRSTATGVHEDPWGRVVVAGAESGHLFLYERSGRLRSKRTTSAETFLNDFDFSGNYVYVTDSKNNAIYRARISRRGLGALKLWMTSADFSVAPDFINGLVATPDGRALLVSDWQVSRTYRVDISARKAEPVIVHHGTLGGDGLLLSGHTAVAVDNNVNPDGSLTSFARKARFNDDYTEAWVVDDSEHAGPSRQPTTIAQDGRRLIWVESQFGAQHSSPPYIARVVRGLR